MCDRKCLFAVAGDPVLHSLSPSMFENAFRKEGIDGIYTRVTGCSAEEVLGIARDTGITGLNVTSPFKEDMLGLLDIIDDHAKRIGAVNTVVIRDGISCGYNTDYIGVRDAFYNRGIDLFGKRALVIGAGGAARAATYALVSKGARVTVINRTYKKAEEVADALGARPIPFSEMDDAVSRADVIILCISEGRDTISYKAIKSGTVIMDANYSTYNPFLIDNGLKVIDSRDWLLYQGAASFEIFTGIKPPVDAMKRALHFKNEDGKKRRNISLVGFMGAGKTDVARRLSLISGLDLVDVDSVIEKKAGFSIQEIFHRYGETFFRSMEEIEIEQLERLSGNVIACGGGAVLSHKNRKILKRNSMVIWLFSGMDTILKRLDGSRSRPLFSSLKGKDGLTNLYDKRLPCYMEVADLIIRTDEMDIESVARKIYEEMHKIIGY